MFPLKLQTWQERGTKDGGTKRNQSGGAKRWPSKANDCVKNVERSTLCHQASLVFMLWSHKHTHTQIQLTLQNCHREAFTTCSIYSSVSHVSNQPNKKINLLTIYDERLKKMKTKKLKDNFNLNLMVNKNMIKQNIADWWETGCQMSRQIEFLSSVWENNGKHVIKWDILFVL